MNGRKHRENKHTFPADDSFQYLKEGIPVEEMAHFITKNMDADKSYAIKIARHYRHVLQAQLEQFGRTDYFGIGTLQIAEDDPEAAYTFIPYPEELARIKKGLIFELWENAEPEKIGETILLQNNIHIEFQFPDPNFIESMAERRGIPAAQLEQTYQEQLDKAYVDAIETGEGVMPDFGVLRYPGPTPDQFEFEVTEELAEIFEEYGNK